jgi:hypothetical protein
MLFKNMAGFDWVGHNGWPMLKHSTDLHCMLFGSLYLWVRIGKKLVTIFWIEMFLDN